MKKEIYLVFADLLDYYMSNCAGSIVEDTGMYGCFSDKDAAIESAKLIHKHLTESSNGRFGVSETYVVAVEAMDTAMGMSNFKELSGIRIFVIRNMERG